MHLRSGTQVLLCMSTTIMIVATAIHCVAFGTRHWLVTTDPTSPFQSLGFHEVCFLHCRQPYCKTNGGRDSEITGCSRIYNDNFRYIHKWLLPDWYLRCRLLSILLVPGTFLSFVCLLPSAIFSCLGEYDVRQVVSGSSWRTVAVNILLAVAMVFMFTSFVIGIVLLSTFHMMAYEDGWMPIPEINEMGYSYWMQGGAVSCIAASIVLTTLAFMCTLQRQAKMMSVPAARSYSAEMTLGS